MWLVGRVAGASEGGDRSLDGQAHVDLTATSQTLSWETSLTSCTPTWWSRSSAMSSWPCVTSACRRPEQCQSLQYASPESTAQVHWVSPVRAAHLVQAANASS